MARLRAANGERVLYVVPRDVSLEEVDLRVLRREAVVNGAEIALVTDSPALRSAADRVGISTFRTSERAVQARWRRIRSCSRCPCVPTTIRWAPRGARACVAAR